MKRGGKGESWSRQGEYETLNLEDEKYLCARAAREPAFSAGLRSEAAKRRASGPPCHRLERFLEDLDRVAPPADNRK